MNRHPTPSRPPSRRAALQALLAAGLAAPLAVAQAQGEYPNRVIRLVVTLPAGTSADAMARFVAERLGKELGQTVIVENKPGASSILGAQSVASAAADGYTLLYGLAPSISLNPHVFKKLPYKASDFVPIIHLLDAPFVLVVRADSPYRSVHELVKAAQAQPDRLTYASYGQGSPNHVAVLQFLRTVGATMTHVPYKDGGLMDLVGGRIDCSLDVTAMAVPQIEAGKLRPLVVSARSRLERLPNVPTFAEAGLGEPLYAWNGIFAPAGTPPNVLARLAGALQLVTSRPDFQHKVREFVQVPRGGTPADFAAFLAKDFAAWGQAVAVSKIQLD